MYFKIKNLLERHQIIIYDYFNGYSDIEYITIIKEYTNKNK